MKRLVLVLAALCASITVLGPQAFAQPKPPPPKGTVSPQAAKISDAEIAVSKATPAFLKLHDSSKVKFEQIQSLISGIENGKLIHDGDSQKLEKLMFDYATDFKAAFDQANSEADEASKSKGQKGSIQSLKSFEDLAQQHEKVAKTFEPRVAGIQSKLKTGEIKLDKPILQKMSPTDLQDFRKFLAPSGLQQMEKLHPDLMKVKANSSLDRHEEQPLVAQAIPIPFDTLVGNLINDLGPGNAEASLVASCIAPCLARNWAACSSCIVSKGPAAVAAWNTFVGCWNGAGTCNWWHPGNCLRKVGCLFTLISRLA